MGVHDEAPQAAGGDGRRWRARPRLAVLVRSAAVVAPFAAALLAGIAVGVALPTPRTMGDLILAWVGVLVASSITASIVTRYARRLLPLAALLKMTMAFPDRTPSRFAIALRAGSLRTLKKRTLALEQGRSDKAEAAETVLMLVAALGEHDRKTRGHSERVRAYTELIAEEMHIRGRDLDRLRWAALLHDLGKMSVPAIVLNGDRALTDDEWEIIKRHPSEGARLAAPLAAWLGPWAETIHHHHERWDGTGYPDGVAGEEIGLGARIVSVADAFEVMTSGRSYQKSMSLQDAREVLTRNAGTQFDPAVVRAFLNCSLGRVATVAGPLAWLGQTPVLARLATAVGTPTQVVLAASVAVVGAAAIGALPDVLAHPPASALVAAPPPPMPRARPGSASRPPSPGGRGRASDPTTPTVRRPSPPARASS
jgi:putative nucleotidyltransferase with HDIG domain